MENRVDIQVDSDYLDDIVEQEKEYNDRINEIAYEEAMRDDPYNTEIRQLLDIQL